MAMVVYQQPTSLITQNEAFKGVTNEDAGKYRGLSNQGATCYLNGLLQTLFMTPEFRKAIFTWNYNVETDGKEDLCIPLQLQRLFGMLQLSKQRSIDTVALTKSFGWDSSEVFQQQDVQELTRVLFDALEESFKGTQVQNIIDELYAGELIDYLRCIDVDHQSERKDKFLDFSLAIVPFGSDKAMHSLTECIEMFLRPEILNGDNKYYAEKFDRKVDALKGLKFGRLPQIMSVQLKRFVYDFSGVEIVQKKLNDVVKFPMVLDMNKYVATKRRQTFDQDGETCFDPNEEFEAFLREQMDILNRDTKSADVASSSVHIATDSPNYINLADIDDDEPAMAVAVSDEEAVAMDDDMPPLVDFTGMRAPDQVKEDALKAAQEAAAERERVLYGSLSEEAVRALLTERGEWIYELYAVLIHSGAISGGHYYAYIKDLETQRWQNFNDSSVSPIDEQTVRQAWGENISVSNYGTYPIFAKSSTKTRLSSANAYMLMYRQVTPASLGRVSFPSAENVPQYIQDLVQAEEKARMEHIKEEEERRNRLRISVWWDAKEHSVVTSRTATYREFLRIVWTQLNIGPHLMEQDSMKEGILSPETLHTDTSSPSETEKTSDDASAIRFDRFRLRHYNHYNKSRAEAVDLKESGDKILSELLINEYKHLVLETRTSSLEDYEVFYKDGVSLQVEVFQSDMQKFGDTRCVRLPKGSVLLDLKNYLALSSPLLSPGRMTLFKMIPMGQVEARMELLSDDSKRLREDLNLYEGFKIFAEETPLEGSASPAWQAVMKSRSHLNILVNKPPSTTFEFLIEGDLRWRVPELRARVLEVLELGPTVDIRMFKTSSRGQELKDDGLTLMSNAVYAGMNVFVSLGKALKVGMHQLCVVQYTPTEGRSGVVLLPSLESEDEYLRTSVQVSVYPSSVKTKGWETAAMSNLQDIHANIDKLGDLITDSSDPPLLTFPAPSSSDAAAAAGMYRVCGRGEDCDEGEGTDTPCSVDEEVAFQGLMDLTNSTEEVFRENIHNLINTEQLTAVRGLDGRYGHSPLQSENAILLAVDIDEEMAIHAAPIVLSDSHVDLVSPDTVVIVPEALPFSEQNVTCTVCSVEKPLTDGVLFKEVEPSGFGELSVKNQSPVSTVFESLDVLGEICVEASTPIAELRQTLLERLIAVGKLPVGASPHLIRLRDKVGSNPGKVLRDGRTLGESKVYLFDQKSLAVQLLDREENTMLMAVGADDSDVGDALIHIQRWNRSTWSMGIRFEVLLRGSMSVRDVARALGRLTDIPVDSMLALVMPRDSELYLSELQMKTPTRNYGRGWFCPGKESKLLKYMSHELKVQDGDLLILQDVTEPLMELSPADLRSIAIVEAAGSDYPSDSYSSSVSYSQPSSYLFNGPQNMFVGPSLSKSGAATGGVKIKTHQERLRETEKQQTDVATTPVDDGSVDDGLGPLNSSAAENREVQRQEALFEDLL